MEKILFRSTNFQSGLVTFKDAILKGQAPDYGLYVPTTLPHFTHKDILNFSMMEYYEVAFEIIKHFVCDFIPEKDLLKICQQAYNFPVPVKQIDENHFILYLDKGPTASFKDFAARFLARIMSYIATREGINLTVVVATSGDTGGAVAHAFLGLDNIRVIVLFPEKEISIRQRKQMTTLGKNIKAVAVKGTFDDCQALVKRAFNDPVLKHKNLTSANSINFGRLLPQSVYYFKAYVEIKRDDLVFSVPSGNFGNLMGGVLAREMGVPVKKFIVAVNENNEFPEFLKTGVYQPVVPSKKCSSNAMNVGHPSNLARLIDLYGGWLTDERDQNGNVIKKGVMKRQPDIELMRKHFISFSISDDEVDRTIKYIYEKYHIIIEPHGAVSIAAAIKANINHPVCCLETADPAKFPEKIKEVLNIEPPVPETLAHLDFLEEQFTVIENDYQQLVDIII
ncbi:MAG: threonine synthase [Candidatus Omnitrophica bacterium]|nr:threonine synthase [Candidatus Omnitrophota bacterium]